MTSVARVVLAAVTFCAPKNNGFPTKEGLQLSRSGMGEPTAVSVVPITLTGCRTVGLPLFW